MLKTNHGVSTIFLNELKKKLKGPDTIKTELGNLEKNGHKLEMVETQVRQVSFISFLLRVADGALCTQSVLLVDCCHPGVS